ncbi:hypothetical protein TSOC_005498, partial [Tetrabaena socialis]
LLHPQVLHGAHDLLAAPSYGMETARLLRAPFVALNGGHYIVRECAPEVCMHLAAIISSVRSGGR